MKRRNTIGLCFLLFSLVLVSCNNVDDTAVDEEHLSIEVADYFPPVNLERTYINYGDEGEDFYSYQVVRQENDEDGSPMIYIKGMNDLSEGESYKQYEIRDDAVRLVHISNSIMNKAVDELVLTNKKEWEVGDGDDSISYLTDTDLSMRVEGGEFTDSIEVTNIVKTEEEQLISKDYYAPTVGLIKTVSVIDDEDYVMSELYESNAEQFISHGNASTTAEEDDESHSDDQEEILTKNTYTSEKYGFTINIPDSWVDVVKVDTTPFRDDVVGTVNFKFVPKEDVEQLIFSIIIFPESKRDNCLPPEQPYIGTHSNYSYCYILPGEAEKVLLDPENSDYLQQSQHMTYEDVPVVLDTFSFEKDFELKIERESDEPLALPEIKVTNKVSGLNAEHYVNNINEKSFDHIDSYLLHRPVSEETNNGWNLSYYTGESGDIIIDMDRESNIKSVKWKSPEPMNEMSYLYLQWLTQGLGASLSRDEINEFLLLENTPAYSTFGEFNVGFAENENGFIFIAAP